MASNKSSKQSSRKSSHNHRSTLSLQKTEIVINIYDLLPPGKLASMLWTVGSSLLHSGVQISNKEYAYGGHDKRGMTGVYYTAPKAVPPGGTLKASILHGFTIRPQAEIDQIIKEASDVFQGTSYNILTKNCNHFTAYLLERLTGRSGPGWLNRAASIGVALPCVVPKEWIAPPDFESAEGELVDDDEEARSHEGSRMLGNTDSSVRRSVDQGEEEWDSAEERRRGGNGKGKGKAKVVLDTSGRVVPPAERAPTKKGKARNSCDCPEE